MAAAARMVIEGPGDVLSLRPRSTFVETPTVRELTDRALIYLQAGFPVHFRGPSGSGKTTLALHLAAQLGRPVMLVAGDEEVGTSDLVGGRTGYHYRKVLDNFIHSVKKYEEDATQRWVDHRLTVACRDGYTLVYDEFTRSRAEANNALLAVLEEHLLILPMAIGPETYIRVHPEFRAIFTSNPQEYAGVHEAQDALCDRLVTLDCDYYDQETETAIAAARSGLSEDQVAPLVQMVRDFRESGAYDQVPTLRSCIMIARTAAMHGFEFSAETPGFVSICLDVLGSKTPLDTRNRKRREEQQKLLLNLIQHHCGGEKRIGRAIRQSRPDPTGNAS